MEILHVIVCIYTTSSIFLYGIQSKTLIGPNPTHESVLIGTTHKLTCRKNPMEASGSILWEERLNGQRRAVLFINEDKESVDPKYDNFALDSENLYDLVITSIEIEDEGTYLCRYPAISTEIAVVRTVEVRPSSLQMTQGGIDVTSVTLIENAPTFVLCTALGSRPVVTILWYHRMNEGSEIAITTNLTQTNTSNDDGTFNTISTLQYTANRNYNGGILRCETTEQEVAEKREDFGILDVQYSPSVMVHFLDHTIICQADANPDVTQYIISISNANDEYIITIPSCLGIRQCNVPLTLEVQSHVRCNATNELGKNTAEIVAVPDMSLATPGLATTFTRPQEASSTAEPTTPNTRTRQASCGISGDAIAKITIAIILLIVLIVVILICIFVIRARQRDDKAVSVGKKTPPHATEPSVPQMYMELNVHTREKERVYEEPTERDPELIPHGTESLTHVAIHENQNTEYEVFQENGDDFNKDQSQEYVNVQP